VRVKSQWFNQGKPKSPKDIGAAMAFIAWRIAQNTLKNMRKAGFDIDPGLEYFRFLAEVIAFVVQIADRVAYGHFDDSGRREFTTTLAHRVGETLAGNAADLLGATPEQGYKEALVDLVNRRAPEYAEFGYDGAAGPDFAFMRFFASVLVELMPAKDKTWVHDQVIAIEAPEIAATVRRSMDGLLGLAPRRARRAGASGE
jgi:hypothetical protein